MKSLILIALFVLMGIPIVGLMYAWRKEGTVGAGTAVCLLGFYLLMFVGVFVAHDNRFVGGLIAAIVIFYFLSPILISVSSRSSLKQMMDEDIAKYQQTIQFDPKNAAAYGYLGEVYARQHRYDKAIEMLETAIQLTPRHSDKEKYRLRQVIEARAREDAKMIRCEHCRKEIPGSSRICPCCGANPRENFFTWLAQPENMKDVFKTSAVCMVVIAPLVGLIDILPPPVLGTLIISTVIAGGVVLCRSF